MNRYALPFAAFLALSACSSSNSSGPSSAQALLEQRAPEFRARDQEGRERMLSEFRGKVVVLYFYPRDATPGCTAEACAFRDAWQRFETAGAQVLGVSTDDVASHAAFAREHSLPFPLLADTDGAIARSYGVGTTLGMAARVTFVINGNGVVAKVFPDVDPAVHVTEVLSAIGELN
jgi:peroxiredoxin Q/BCP